MIDYFKNTWLGFSTVLIGMKITFKHLFVPAVTRQYPDVKMELPPTERNRLYVNMDDCIGCDQCSKACPVSCIDIQTCKSVPGDEVGLNSLGKKKVLWVTKFSIDFAKCCYCGLCTVPCPTECIKMTAIYEFSEFRRQDFIYNFSTLTSEQIEDKKQKYQKLEAEKAAAKKVQPLKATAGSAQQINKQTQ